jgi:hypothetical protein
VQRSHAVAGTRVDVGAVIDKNLEDIYVLLKQQRSLKIIKNAKKVKKPTKTAVQKNARI